MIKEGTEPFFNPQYTQFGNNIFTDYIAPSIYLICWIFIIIGLFGCLIPTASCTETTDSSITVLKVTDNSISWNIFYKTEVRPTLATLDGVGVTDFDLLHNTTFTAKDLEPNSTHVFCIYKDLTINCESGTTLVSTEENIIEFFGKWLLLFFVILLMIVGVFVPLFDIIALIIAVFAFLDSIITHDFWFILIWGCALCATCLIGYKGLK